MKKKNNVMMIAVIAITLLMIGCVIVMGIIRNSNRNNPDVKPPEQTTDTTDTTPPDQTAPEIPPITDDGKKTDNPEDSSPADITIDVVRPKDDPNEDTPGVVGDVVFSPVSRRERNEESHKNSCTDSGSGHAAVRDDNPHICGVQLSDDLYGLLQKRKRQADCKPVNLYGKRSGIQRA